MKKLIEKGHILKRIENLITEDHNKYLERLDYIINSELLTEEEKAYHSMICKSKYSIRQEMLELLIKEIKGIKCEFLKK